MGAKHDKVKNHKGNGQTEGKIFCSGNSCTQFAINKQLWAYVRLGCEESKGIYAWYYLGFHTILVVGLVVHLHQCWVCMWPCKNNSHIQVLVTQLFFQSHSEELETGTANTWEITNSKPLGPNHTDSGIVVHLHQCWVCMWPCKNNSHIQVLVT